MYDILYHKNCKIQSCSIRVSVRVRKEKEKESKKKEGIKRTQKKKVVIPRHSLIDKQGNFYNHYIANHMFVQFLLLYYQVLYTEHELYRGGNY